MKSGMPILRQLSGTEGGCRVAVLATAVLVVRNSAVHDLNLAKYLLVSSQSRNSCHLDEAVGWGTAGKRCTSVPEVLFLAASLLVDPVMDLQFDTLVCTAAMCGLKGQRPKQRCLR